MYIEKRTQKNKFNSCIINGRVSEFDIRMAGTTAYYNITDDKETYDRLKSLDKMSRNVELGLMIKAQPTLQNKIDKMVLGWINEFIKINKIKESNFIECNNDSITIHNSIPEYLSLDNWKDVEFINKEGDFSSFIRMNNMITIFFDNIRKHIMIKGINKDYYQNSKFVKYYMIPMLSALEGPFMDCFKTKQMLRHEYIISEDTEIYRELNNKNLLTYMNDHSEYIESEHPLEDLYLIKDSNYTNFLLPLIRLKIM